MFIYYVSSDKITDIFISIAKRDNKKTYYRKE